MTEQELDRMAVSTAHSFARGLIARAYQSDAQGYFEYQGGARYVASSGTFAERATDTLRRMAQDASINVAARAVYAGIVVERDARMSVAR